MARALAELRFDILQALFELRERGLRTPKERGLHVELGTAHQIELRELRLQDSLEVRLQVLRKIAHSRGHGVSEPAGKIIETSGTYEIHDIPRGRDSPFDNAPPLSTRAKAMHPSSEPITQPVDLRS
jgi:hypothetical protein